MIYDAFVALCVLGGAVLGAKKGLAIQLAGLASLVLAYVLALPAAKAICAALDDPPPLQAFLVFAGCFAVVSLCCYGLAAYHRKRLEDKELGGWDTQTGAVLGALHGVLVCLLLTVLLVVAIPSLRDPILDRPTGQAMRELFRGVYHALPDEAQEALDPALKRAKSG